MSFARFLAVRNCRRNPSRTAALGLVAALLALALFGGSLVVLSLQNGLNRFQERLGADILVLPKAAQADGGQEGVLVQGKPLQFYMEASRLAEIASLPGVERAAPQFFLTSANAGCCSVAVQLIGFDPATDFTIRPWLLESYAGDVGYGDILCGSGISVPADRRLKFYNVPCRVVGRLSPTGTGMDTAVYANMKTIRAMMKNAAELDFASFQGVDPEQAISAVLVKTCCASGFWRSPSGWCSRRGAGSSPCSSSAAQGEACSRESSSLKPSSFLLLARRAASLRALSCCCLLPHS